MLKPGILRTVQFCKDCGLNPSRMAHLLLAYHLLILTENTVLEASAIIKMRVF